MQSTARDRKTGEPKKKKALGERAGELWWKIREPFIRWACGHMAWKTRDRRTYLLLPGDMIVYWKEYHPKSWRVFRDWILPVMSSVAGAMLGMLAFARWFKP